MGSEGFFVDPPARNGKLPWLGVIRAPETGTMRCILLSTKPVGVRIHRIGKSPYRCPGSGCTVPGCPNTGRWNGYIEIMPHDGRLRNMLEITSDVNDRLEDISIENSNSLRGLDIRLERGGTKRNSIIIVTLMDILRNEREIPAARDMHPFVDRLFKNKS